MNSYVFMTDSDSDLPFRYVDELDLTLVYMPYMIDGKEYYDDLGRSGKQKEYFDLHYNADYSLSEIAEETGISRQGVWDIIKRAEETLRKTEEKTGLIRRFREHTGITPAKYRQGTAEAK